MLDIEGANDILKWENGDYSRKKIIIKDILRGRHGKNFNTKDTFKIQIRCPSEFFYFSIGVEEHTAWQLRPYDTKELSFNEFIKKEEFYVYVYVNPDRIENEESSICSIYFEDHDILFNSHLKVSIKTSVIDIFALDPGKSHASCFIRTTKDKHFYIIGSKDTNDEKSSQESEPFLYSRQTNLSKDIDFKPVKSNMLIKSTLARWLTEVDVHIPNPENLSPEELGHYITDLKFYLTKQDSIRDLEFTDIANNPKDIYALFIRWFGSFLKKQGFIFSNEWGHGTYIGIAYTNTFGAEPKDTLRLMTEEIYNGHNLNQNLRRIDFVEESYAANLYCFHYAMNFSAEDRSINDNTDEVTRALEIIANKISDTTEIKPAVVQGIVGDFGGSTFEVSNIFYHMPKRLEKSNELEEEQALENSYEGKNINAILQSYYGEPYAGLDYLSNSMYDLWLKCFTSIILNKLVDNDEKSDFFNTKKDKTGKWICWDEKLDGKDYFHFADILAFGERSFLGVNAFDIDTKNRFWNRLKKAGVYKIEDEQCMLHIGSLKPLLDSVVKFFHTSHSGDSIPLSLDDFYFKNDIPFPWNDGNSKAWCFDRIKNIWENDNVQDSSSLLNSIQVFKDQPYISYCLIDDRDRITDPKKNVFSELINSTKGQENPDNIKLAYKEFSHGSLNFRMTNESSKSADIDDEASIERKSRETIFNTMWHHVDNWKESFKMFENDGIFDSNLRVKEIPLYKKPLSSIVSEFLSQHDVKYWKDPEVEDVNPEIDDAIFSNLFNDIITQYFETSWENLELNFHDILSQINQEDNELSLPYKGDSTKVSMGSFVEKCMRDFPLHPLLTYRLSILPISQIFSKLHNMKIDINDLIKNDDSTEQSKIFLPSNYYYSLLEVIDEFDSFEGMEIYEKGVKLYKNNDRQEYFMKWDIISTKVKSDYQLQESTDIKHFDKNTAGKPTTIEKIILDQEYSFIRNIDEVTENYNFAEIIGITGQGSEFSLIKWISSEYFSQNETDVYDEDPTYAKFSINHMNKNMRKHACAEGICLKGNQEIGAASVSIDSLMYPPILQYSVNWGNATGESITLEKGTYATSISKDRFGFKFLLAAKKTSDQNIDELNLIRSEYPLINKEVNTNLRVLSAYDIFTKNTNGIFKLGSGKFGIKPPEQPKNYCYQHVEISIPSSNTYANPEFISYRWNQDRMGKLDINPIEYMKDPNNYVDAEQTKLQLAINRNNELDPEGDILIMVRDEVDIVATSINTSSFFEFNQWDDLASSISE